MKLWNDDQQARPRWPTARLPSPKGLEACVWSPPTPNGKRNAGQARAQGFVSVGKEEAPAPMPRPGARPARHGQGGRRLGPGQVQGHPGRAGPHGALCAFDGIVAKIVGELGEYSTPIAARRADAAGPSTSSTSTCLYVTGPMDEVDAPKIKPASRCASPSTPLPKQALPGKVRRVALRVRCGKQARTVDIEVDFEGARRSAGKLLVGYSADVEILLRSARQGPCIFHRCPARGRPGPGLNPETEARGARTVKTGLANWEYTEIAGGCVTSLGDRIVTSLEKRASRPG